MQEPQHNEAPTTAHDIRSDLDSLRELQGSELRQGWLRQFALLFVLITAFVALVWLGIKRKDDTQPSIFNGGVTLSEDFRDGAWIGSALEQALVATLLAGDQVHVVNPRPSTATFPRFDAGADATAENEAQWRLDARLRPGVPDSGTAIVHLTLQRAGETVFRTDVIGTASAIGDLATRSVEQIHAWLDLGGLSGSQIDIARNEIPSPAASRAYGQGLAALRAHDGRTALAHFRDAAAAEPDNAAVHDGLARAWDLLGYANNAARAAQLAFEASGGLSRRRQLELEAQYALRSESWERAEQVFGALKEFNPDDLSYRLALADMQIQQNDAQGLQESVREMRALPPPAGGDPRIDLTEGSYWFNTGDYGRCLGLARDARAKAETSGNKFLLGEALLAIGRCDDTFDPGVLLEARDVFRELDTPLREPEILRELGNNEYGLGNVPEYVSYLEQSVAVSRELGDEPQIAASNNSLARAYDLLGKLNKGYELKVAVADYQKERANLTRHSIVLENIGISLYKLGRYEEAEATIDQAAEIFERIDDKIGIAWLPYRRGQIAIRSGDLVRARTLIEQAIANAVERPEGNLALDASFELALIDHHSGNHAAANERFEQAQRLYTEKGLTLSLGETEIALARVDVALGDRAAAAEHLEAAALLLEDEVAYYALSLQIERTDFELLTDDEERRKACERLEQLQRDQEHAEYVLRARVRLAACGYTVFGATPAQTEAALTRIEADAAQAGVFEAQLAALHARAFVREAAGDGEGAAQDTGRARELATTHHWAAVPMPDFALP